MKKILFILFALVAFNSQAQNPLVGKPSLKLVYETAQTNKWEFTVGSSNTLTIDGTGGTPVINFADFSGTGTSLAALSSGGNFTRIANGTNGDYLTLSAGVPTWTTGSFVSPSRTLTIAGTANEITSSAGAQDLSANRAWTLSLPSALTFTGKTVTGGTLTGLSTVAVGGTIDSGVTLQNIGTAALDGTAPVKYRIEDLQNGTWTAGAESAAIEYYSNDVTGGGIGVNGKIAFVKDGTGGGTSGLEIYVGGTGSLVKAIDITGSAGAATFADAITSTTLNTGQGANELYDMDQDVLTTSDPTFDNLTVSDINTGSGAVELAAGIYAATITNGTNVASSSAAPDIRYLRIGDNVIVSGRIDIDPTSSSVETKFTISLPIASNLTDNTDLNGSGTWYSATVVGIPVYIGADFTTDTAQFTYYPSQNANLPIGFTFSYYIK